MTNYDNKEFVAQVQDAVLTNPGVATGLTWRPYRQHRKNCTVLWRTNQRPDGSETKRKNKQTICILPNGSARVEYNGVSFESCDLWTYLRDHYGVNTNGELFSILKNEYGITDNYEPMKTYPRKPSPRTATPKTETIPTIGDESDVCTIPADLVAKSIDLFREDSLRSYLEILLDPFVLEGAWHLYGVGITKDGHPVFWYYDRQGRCRDGKVMRYRNDGHRDKDAPGSVLAVGAMMQKSGHLPESWSRSGCLYGEHLLDRWPEATIGLVESEKTALACAVCFPRYIWLATGGMKQNIDRAKAVLNGRRVIAFPDADATEYWTEKFQGLPGWSISTVAKDYEGLCGSKCDLCDVLVQQATQEKKES